MASYTKTPAKNKQGYKWICVIDGPPDPVTQKRSQIKRRGDTKRVALSSAEAEYKRRAKGMDSKKIKKLTFSLVADEWLKVYENTGVKEQSVITRATQVDLLKEYFSDHLIAKISHREYQNYLNLYFEKGYLNNTLNGVNNAANMIFKYAIKNKLITENPVTDIIIPKKKVTIEDLENEDLLIEEKYLDRSELSCFLQIVSTYGKVQEKEVFFLLAFSGLRSGELCALKWKDIDSENNYIRVAKTLVGNNRKKYKLGTPKTKQSFRVVPIDSTIINMLMLHNEHQRERKNKEIEYYPNYHDADFVFRNDEGYPYTPQRIYGRMKSLLKKTNIKKHSTPHIFRHTYVSMLAEAGVDLITIMRRVGHTNERTTLNIYTHITKKMQQNADKKLKKHYASVLNLSVLQQN